MEEFQDQDISRDEDAAQDEDAIQGEISLIPDELRNQLLVVIGDWVNTGRILITNAHFEKAIEEAYQALSGGFPSQEIREQLSKTIALVNQENPETFVIPGMENWITQSVMGVVRQRKWGIAEVQERGQGEIRNFVRQDKVRALLDQFGLTANQLNLRNCMRAVTNQVAGKEEPQHRRSKARLEQVMATLKAQQTQKVGPVALQRLLTGEAAPPDEQEANTRKEEQKKLQTDLRQDQMQHLRQNLDLYVQQGKLSEEDAGRLRKLNTVDEAVKKGKVTQEQGSKVRNSILTGNVAHKLERKVRDAVDSVVVYQQVFEALKRMDPRYDPALRFLISHKQVVNSEQREVAEWKEITEGLIEDLDTLHLLIDMMDRQDAEVRMMAARLPPYSLVVRRGQDRVENLVIDEAFIDDLRKLSREEIGQRLNAPQKGTRVRAAASMLSMNALVSRLIKPTPFRKELRLLKINLIIEEFFRSTDNLEEAREKAQEFLRTRLRHLFPDLDPLETEEIQQRGAELIESVEQQIITQRQESTRLQAGEDGKLVVGTQVDDEQLSEEEVSKGAQLGRVAMRTGAGMRLVPFKVMPDEEEPGKFVLVKRDADSGELVPVLRRGEKRQVTRNREGIWELD